MADYTIQPLGPDTWPDFAALVERQGTGKMGAPACWCVNFHPGELDVERNPDGRRALKKRLVADGRAHAALVFDGDVAVGWCQYGHPDELPGIHHRRDYEAGLFDLPDYRITCIFVDRRYRRKGLSAVALQGALDLISETGGGVVEGYPHDNQGKKKSVLYNGTRTLFERAGFTYVRSKGTGNCVMRRTVP